MAAKTSWHRYGTKLRHCHPMYTNGEGDATDLHQLDRHFVGVTRRAGKNRFLMIVKGF